MFTSYCAVYISVVKGIRFEIRFLKNEIPIFAQDEANNFLLKTVAIALVKRLLLARLLYLDSDPKKKVLFKQKKASLLK